MSRHRLSCFEEKGGGEKTTEEILKKIEKRLETIEQIMMIQFAAAILGAAVTIIILIARGIIP